MHPGTSVHHQETTLKGGEVEPPQSANGDNEIRKQNTIYESVEMANPAALIGQQGGETMPHPDTNTEASQSRPLSPLNDKLESSSDLQFKKKDYQRSRTLLFQSVLSSVSLKSLKHQYTTPKPALERNTSNLLQQGIKNFQSYIQAPVLLLVTNPRSDDNVAIGQRLPFDAEGKVASKNSLNLNERRPSTHPAADAGASDDDIYKEETILQQQKLTLNALKKLSLSLAPIIRPEEEEEANGSTHRVASTLRISSKLLNSPNTNNTSRNSVSASASNMLTMTAAHPESAANSGTKVSHESSKAASDRVSKPYLPAEVDLSQFSSLTRQGRFSNRPEREPLVKSPISTNEISSPVSATEPSGRVLFPDNAPASTIPEQLQPFVNLPLSENQRINDQLNNGREKPELKLNMTRLQDSFDVQANSTSPKRNQASSHANQNLRAPNPLTELYVGRTNNNMSEKSSMNAPNIPNRALPLKKLQQINGFRSPMYIPAVLRKTETAVDDDDATNGDTYLFSHDPRIGAYHGAHPHHSPSSAPISVATTANNSSNVLIRSNDLASSQTGNNGTTDNDYSTYRIPNGSAPKTSSSSTGPFPLSHNANIHNKGARYVQYHLHIVNAPPTRHHWLKDESVAECGILSCKKKFNFFERRHHCRKCGGIFCKEHTLHYLYINHLAQFTTGGRGTLSRVCARCIAEYREFAKREYGTHDGQERLGDPRQNASAQNLSNSSSQNEPGAYRATALEHRQDSFVTSPDENSKDTVVGSVPANWSWSSF
ncbi:hypothetical protein PUMCH_000705 [Australozyma saopauloensis]|uniref:FYVE-type domain-containing protein n=1 Tax=Australozyma saopauloensis TaxID=291208 RepID=A0AAX4H4M9_9ASCO|nr:hypothetical protein PUMCH_000705 [[Candida] saopauloensis]